MRRALAILIAFAALACVAGCGSSESSSSTPSTTAGTSSSRTSRSSTSGKPREGLIPNGKINYAKPTANAPTQGGTIKVTYREFTIEPDTIKAKVGASIRWTNEDPQPCNVTSEGGSGGYKFASKDFGEGGTFELKLDKPGTIHYECTHFPTTMNGTIEVVS